MKKSFIKMLVFTVALLPGLALLGLGAQAILETQAAYRYPPAGQMLEAGGYRLHLVCQGEGSGPTVVFISGWPDTYLVWQKVQPQVAERGPVCSYDRAGIGWSEEPHGRQDWSGQEIARELQIALAGSGIPGPYILVGHSLGGAVARIYAGKYPQEVAGMVLVDPVVQEDFNRQPPAFHELQEQLLTILNVGRLAAPFGLTRLVQPTGFTHSRLPEAVRPASLAITLRAQTFRTAYYERAAFPSTLAQAETAGIVDVPVVVLAARHTFSQEDLPPEFPMEESNLIHLAVLKELAQKYPKGQIEVSEKSDHYIQLNDPNTVVQAIQTVLRR